MSSSKTHSNHKKASADAKVRRASPDYVLIENIRRVYAHVCRTLDSADPEDDEYCLLLSNGADELAALISGFDMLMEARL
jgi:hypothetical protein